MESTAPSSEEFRARSLYRPYIHISLKSGSLKGSDYENVLLERVNVNDYVIARVISQGTSTKTKRIVNIAVKTQQLLLQFPYMLRYNISSPIRICNV